MAFPPDGGSHSPSHQSLITDQFTRQAELFANSPVLHDVAALDALVQAARPGADDVSLDVACGPGTVVVAFANHVRHATGLDCTGSMLAQAGKLSASRAVANVSWQQGDIYALPFKNNAFDIVSCRFAFHHFEEPAMALAEMVRVCRSGGRIVLCDAVAPDDPKKAAALNAMERYRDPSTVEFRTFAFLTGLFGDASLPAPASTFYQVPVELEALLKVSFPLDDERDRLRKLISDTIDGNTMGVNARRDGETIRFNYTAAILVSTKP